MNAKIETTTLRNGTKVLASTRNGFFGAVTYTNYKQAEKKIAELINAGVAAELYMNGFNRTVKYIRINDGK